MDLGDNDLLDLFLARSEPEGELARPEVREVLQLMRSPPPDRLDVRHFNNTKERA